MNLTRSLAYALLLLAGKWLVINGEAINGTAPTLLGPETGSPSAREKDKKSNSTFVPA